VCFCANSSPTTFLLTSSATWLKVVLRSQEPCGAEVGAKSLRVGGGVQDFVALMSQSFARSNSKLKPP
jgi:hypothetical protein